MNDHTLAAQLQTLIDTAAIRELKYRYLNACDEKLPDQVSACFAAGPIVIDYGHIGRFSTREDFVQVFVELGCHPHIVDMHHAQNPIVEMTGADRARGKIGLRFQSINCQAKTSVQIGGTYRDEYCRIEGEWLITRSQFTVTSVAMRDFSGDYEVLTYAGNAMPEAPAAMPTGPAD